MAKRKSKKSKRRGKSLQRTAESLIGIAAYVGPEVGAVMAGGFTPEAIANAVSLKTGYNFLDGSFDPSRLILGWGPSLAFTAAKKGKSVVNKILSSV